MIKFDKDIYIAKYLELFTSIEKAINVFTCLIDNKNPHVSIGIAIHAISKRRATARVAHTNGHAMCAPTCMSRGRQTAQSDVLLTQVAH